MLEFFTAVASMWTSFAMTSANSGGNANHDQKAMKKPNQEKKNTRPYLLIGLKMGTDRAFWLTGLTSGAKNHDLGLARLITILAVGRGAVLK